MDPITEPTAPAEESKRSERKKLLIIDGNSVLNRAFYGIRPLNAPDGTPTAAVYGTANMLISRIEALSPDYAAAAFDLPAPTFRHKRYEGYKATRHKMPDELAVQLPLAKEMCRALGFTVLEKEGFEADDILGTLASLGEKEDCEVYILTGDRDSLQLVSQNVSVLLASTGETPQIGPKEFFEKYQTEPPRLVDLKALMGDSSDNIPGVGGIGEKTAIKLISTFGTLDGVYAALDALAPDGVLPKKLGDFPVGASAAAALLKDRDNAYLSLELARICREVPLDLSVDELRRDGYRRGELYSLCSRLGLSAIIRKLSLSEADSEGAPDAENPAQTAAPVEILPKEELTEKECLALPEGDAPEGEYALVFEDSEGGLMPGLNISGAGGGKHFFVSDADASAAAEFISRRRVILRDSKEDLALLRGYGAKELPRGENIFDVSLAAYVLDSTAQDYSVARLAAAYGLTYTDEESTALALRPILEEELEKTGQTVVYRDIEQPLSFVLADIENSGFRIDRAGLAAFGGSISAEAAAVQKRIHEYAGEEFNIASPKQLGEVLFEHMGLPHAKKKTKSGYSTAAEVLEELRPYHPIIDEILRYRQLSKLQGTYVDGLLSAADPAGRVHTVFRQTVTATGRLSSTEPNLQNIPIRTPLGREMRRFFIPADGYVLVDADYSQIELRLLALMSGDETMQKAFADGADIHRITASQVFGVAPEEVTEAQRKDAKAVNFGIVYGISDFSLGADLGIGKWKAGEYIRSYFATYPGVERFMNDVTEKAKEDGFVTTLFGRRRYIPELKAGKANLRAFGERVARNSPIQGTAADVIKFAMLRTDRALRESGIDGRMILQVHDELVLEVKKGQEDAAAALLRDAMEGAGRQIGVSLPVEVETGRNWYL